MVRLTLAAGGASREETSDEVAVLHFTYNKFDDLKSRRDRCDCAPTEEDAKRCFILPFDRMVCSPPPAPSPLPDSSCLRTMCSFCELQDAQLFSRHLSRMIREP